MSDNYFYRPDLNELEVPSISERKKNVAFSEFNHRKIHVRDQNLLSPLSYPDADQSFLDVLSTHILICNEKILEKGEDSGLEIYTSEAGIMGVFDGCGGMGSRTCTGISNKTEAYLASRAVCNAVKMWFYANSEYGYTWDINHLKDLIISNLSICQNQSGNQEMKLKGSLIRLFPSTIALAAFRIVNGELFSEHIWAGDSRTYCIDHLGLGQISIDDIKGEDAMSNLTKDSALTNVLSADKNFILHRIQFKITGPCIILAATDGCFGYVSSPMEFELMILSTLIHAVNVDEWQGSLNDEIMNRSGDDQTITVAAFGFDEFSDMKAYYLSRYHTVLEMVREFDSSDSDNRQNIWRNYKTNYYRYMTKEM